MLQALRDPLRVFTDFVVKPASYIIFTDGSRYYAKNGSTGAIEYVDTDATNVIQYAVDNAPKGGAVFLKVGTYRLSDTINIWKPLMLAGEGVGIVLGSRDIETTWLAAPQEVYGVILVQTKQGADVIRITGMGIQVDLENIVLTWDDSIKNSNTGHGIYGIPPIITRRPGNGVYCFYMRNIIVIGNDGDHYGIYLVNPLYGHMANIYVFGGGGVAFETNSDLPGNYGNMLVDELFVEISNPGTAHGIFLKGTTRYINLIHFNRPQVNIRGTASDTQKHLTYSGYVMGISINGANFEQQPGYARGGIDLPPRSYMTIEYIDIKGWFTDIPHDTVFISWKRGVRSFISPDSVSSSWISINGKAIWYQSGARGTTSVPAGATSVTISFTDIGSTDYMVVAEPSWATRYYVTDKTRNRCVLNFDTPAPADGGTVKWFVVRFS